MNDVKRRQRRPVGQGGFTLIELIIVVAVISIVAALAVPLYANEEARARIAEAQARVRTLACAVNLYAAHMGTLPVHLAVLTTTAVNGRNESAGPFAPSIPPPPWGGVTGLGRLRVYVEHRGDLLDHRQRRRHDDHRALVSESSGKRTVASPRGLSLPDEVEVAMAALQPTEGSEEE